MENTNSSFARGILGAVIGSIPGILLWILLGYIGYTSAIVGFVMAIGIIFGFVKMGGDLMSGAGIAVCVVVLLIAIYVGEHMSWAVSLSKELKEIDEAYTAGFCASHLYDLLELGEIKGSFFLSLGQGYLFGILGAFGTFKKVLRG